MEEALVLNYLWG